MKYAKLFSAALVSMCMFVSPNFAHAKTPKGKATKGKSSHKHNHHVDHQQGPATSHENQRTHHAKHLTHDRVDHNGKHHVNRHKNFHNEQRGQQFNKDYREGHDDHHAHNHDDHDGYGDGHRPRDMQRLNEDRKLQRRRDQAEHLRKISERNGNLRLAETADRMEQKALEHYDERLQRIGQHESPYRQTTDSPIEPAPSPTRETDQDRTSPSAQPTRDSLSEFSDGFQRRLLNEQRELRRRLETADRLRRSSDFNGDQQLRESADRIEDAAFERFYRRSQSLGEPLTSVQQSQLDDFVDRSVTGMLEQQPDRIQSRGINDLETAVFDQPLPRLFRNARQFLNR